MVDNNWKVGITACLDSDLTELNKDISALSKKIEKLKLKAELDKNINISSIQNQLNDITATIGSAQFSHEALNNLKSQVESYLSNNKINISSNIDLNQGTKNVSTQANQLGQQAGKQFSQGMQQQINNVDSSLNKISSRIKEINQQAVSSNKSPISYINPTQFDTVEKKIEYIKSLFNSFGNVTLNPKIEDGSLKNVEVKIKNVNGDLKETLTIMGSFDNATNNVSFGNIIKGTEQFVQHMDQAKNSLQQFANMKLPQLTLESTSGNYALEVESLSQRFAKLGTSYSDASSKLPNVAQQLNLLKISQQELDAELQKDVVDVERVKNAFERYQTSLSSARKSVSKASSIYMNDDATKNLVSGLKTFYANNSAMSRDAKAQINSYINSIQQAGTITKNQASQIKSSWKQIETAEQQAGRLGDGFAMTMKKSMQSFSYWLSATYVIMRVIQGIKGAVNTVIELDTALVDLQKTTTMNSSALEKFYENSSNIAREMGVTTKEIINQAAAWSRLGYSSAESAEKMAKLSSQFAAISPGMDVNKATEGLVSIMKAYDIAPDQVLDGIESKINIIGNTAATSNADIVEMLTRSSSAMAEANNSLEETIALETAAVEITQDPTSVGTAFKTLSMRIRGYDEETESFSNDVEILNGKVASLTKTATTPGGISLFTDSSKTEYKSTYQLLEEISKIYNDLTDKDQAALLEVLAGKRQGQIVAATLKNFSAAEKAIDSMANSAGSADREMEVISNSIEYKLNALNETWTSIAQNLFNRGDMKGLIDFLTGLSKALEFATDKLGLFGTVAAGIGLFAGYKNVGLFKVQENQILLFGKSLDLIRQKAIATGSSLNNAFSKAIPRKNVDTRTSSTMNTSTTTAPLTQENYVLAENMRLREQRAALSEVEQSRLRTQANLQNSVTTSTQNETNALREQATVQSQLVTNINNEVIAEEKQIAAIAENTVASRYYTNEQRQKALENIREITGTNVLTESIIKQQIARIEALPPLSEEATLEQVVTREKEMEALANLKLIDSEIQRQRVLSTTATTMGVASRATSVFATALNMIVFTLAIKAIEKVVSVVDNYINRIQIATDKMNDSKSAFESTANELDNINSELVAQNSEMDKLLAKDNLTYSEKGELDKLKDITQELQIQQDILQRKKENDTYSLAEDTLDVFEKQFGDVTPKSIDKSIKESSSNNWAGILNVSSGKNDIAGNLLELKNYQKLFDETETKLKNTANMTEVDIQLLEEEYQNYGDGLELVNNKISKNLDDLFEQKNNLENAYDLSIAKQQNGEFLTSYDKDIISSYETIVGLIEKIYSLVDPNKWTSIKLSNLFNTEGLQDVKDKLVAEAKENNGKLDTSSISNYNGLSDALQKNNISSTELVNEINSIAAEELKLKETTDNTISSIVSFSDAWNELSFTEDSELKNTRDNLEKLAENGQLCVETFLDTKGASTFLSKLGIDAETAIDSILDLYSSSQKLASLDNGLDKVSKVYDEFSKKGYALSSTIESLPESFKGLESFDAFSTISSNAKSSASEIQQAFNNLVTEYISTQNTLTKLTSENAKEMRDVYITQLSNMGITNAADVVDSYIQSANELNNLADAFSNVTDNAYATDYALIQENTTLDDNTSKTIANKISKIDLSNVTASSIGVIGGEINALLTEANATNQTKAAIASLVAEQAIFNNTGLNVSNKISALSALAQSFGIVIDGASAAAQTVKNIELSKSLTAGATNSLLQSHQNSILQGIGDKFRSAMAAKFGNIKTVSYSGGGGGSSSSGSSGGKGSKGSKGSSQKDTKKEIDWIARAVETLENKIDQAKSKFDSLFEYKSKHNNLKKQIEYTTSLLEIQGRAADQYKSKYNSYTKKNKISSSMKKKIQQGKYKGKTKDLIVKYGSKTADKINQAQEYWDAYQESISGYYKQANEIANLVKERLDLIAEKYDKKRNSYETKNSLLETKYENIGEDNVTSRNKNLSSQISNSKSIYNSYKSEYTEKKSIQKSYSKSLTKNLSNKTVKKKLNKTDRKKISDLIKKGKLVPDSYLKKVSNAGLNTMYRNLIAYNQTVDDVTDALNSKNQAEADYKKQKREKEIDQLQNKADLSESKVNKSRARAENAKTVKDKNKYEKDARKNLKDEYDLLIKIAKKQGQNNEAEKLKSELVKEIAESYKTEFDNISSSYDFQISESEHLINLYDAQIEQLELLGQKAKTSFITSQIEEYNKQIDTTQKELNDLIKKRDEYKNNENSKNTDIWKEMTSDINNVEEKLADLNNTVISLQNSLRELSWEKFEEASNGISRMTDELEFMYDFLDSDKFFEKLEGRSTGSLTDIGKSAFALQSAQYESYQNQIQRLYTQLQSTYDDWINSGDSDANRNLDIYKQYVDYVEQYQDAVSKSKNIWQNIGELIKNQLQSLSDGLKELISDYEDALDNAKNLRDYQKSISEKNTDVQNLRAQIQALSGDSSEENRARLQSLFKSLSDAEEDLQETEYDQWLTDQKSMLSELEDGLEKYISDIDVDTLIKQTIDNADKNSKDVIKTIEDESAKWGYRPQYTTDILGGIASGESSITNSITSNIDRVIAFFDNVYDSKIDDYKTDNGESNNNTTPNVSGGAGAEFDERKRSGLNELTDEFHKGSSGMSYSTNSYKQYDSNYRSAIESLENANSVNEINEIISNFKSLTSQAILNDSKEQIDSNYKKYSKDISTNPTLAKNYKTSYDNALSSLSNADASKAQDIVNTFVKNSNIIYSQYASLLSTRIDSQIKDFVRSNSDPNSIILLKLGLQKLGYSFKNTGPFWDSEMINNTKKFANKYKITSSGKEFNPAMKVKLVQLLKAKGFKNGGSNIQDLIGWTQENGMELVRTSDGALLTPTKGSTVFNADQTKALWDISKAMTQLDISKYNINKASSNNNNNSSSSVEFSGSIIMNGVNDPQTFATQLKTAINDNVAVQKTIQSYTVDRLSGRSNSLLGRKF